MFVYDKNGAAFTRVQEEKAKELGTALYVADGMPRSCLSLVA